MSTQYIVIFGTASLQQYIFQSNRLKENIGASYLAKHWLEKGLVTAVKADTTEWKRYESNPFVEKPKTATKIGKQDIHLIYIGGGNAALLCGSREAATGAVEAWSLELLKNAPGLRGVVGYGEVKGSLVSAYREALKDLMRCEEALPFGSSLSGLPMAQTCPSTGLPASERSDGELRSQSAARKRAIVGTKTNFGKAQTTIEKEFCQVLKPKENLPQQHFAIELEDLGGYEGESHIAVVHADGNGMGDKLIKVIDESDEDNFFHNLRRFSASVSRLSKRALQETLKELKCVLPLDSLRSPKGIFPFRPIIHGGDDLTFVCDGRLGLHLAALYLEKFKGNIPIVDECEFVDACAGVAIVPTKFPFARAYGFADELCRLTKAHRRSKGNSVGSWLDFQIIQEGATKSITALRDTQYVSLTGQKLHQRPYQVPEKWNDPKKADTFIQVLKWFQSSKWPRNRAKNLLQELVKGPGATQRSVDAAAWRGIKLPAGDKGWTGPDNWEDAKTVYFDPLKALDFYLPELLK